MTHANHLVADFPYLVTPLEAIKAEVLSNGGTFESVIDNYATAQQTALAHRTLQVGGACIVFANSDAGEGYIIFDGNEGDRNNLTLWDAGDELINRCFGVQQHYRCHAHRRCCLGRALVRA